MLMDMCLPKFGIYQGPVATIVLETTQTLGSLIFKKIVLSDVLSEIHLVRYDNVSIG